MKTITKNLKVDTWLPIFSGFYGTIWETDEDEEREIEVINDKRAEANLPKAECDDIEWDYDGYSKSVAEYVTHDVTAKLIELGYIHKGEFQELKSPREYNFYNDSINVCFTLNASNVDAIAKYLEENQDEFTKYLAKHYTSYSGFLSNYSNRLEDWLTDLPATLSDDHKLGAVLQFILLSEEGPDYEMELYEHATGNGCTLQAKNYSALIDGGK